MGYGKGMQMYIAIRISSTLLMLAITVPIGSLLMLPGIECIRLLHLYLIASSFSFVGFLDSDTVVQECE